MSTPTRDRRLQLLPLSEMPPSRVVRMKYRRGCKAVFAKARRLIPRAARDNRCNRPRIDRILHQPEALACGELCHNGGIAENFAAIDGAIAVAQGSPIRCS